MIRRNEAEVNIIEDQEVIVLDLLECVADVVVNGLHGDEDEIKEFINELKLSYPSLSDTQKEAVDGLARGYIKFLLGA